MRKLKLQVQISVDGYISGPNGEMDWMTWNWDGKLVEFVSGLHTNIDCILLGRKLAEGFIPHWAGVAADPTNPEQPFGKLMTDTPKVVFTKTMNTCNWINTTLATGDLVTEVTKLKQQEGKDIIVYGGATFVSSLIKEGLIDELNLFVNPVAMGKGMAIFEGLTNLKLADAIPFQCGIVAHIYQGGA